MNSPARMLLRLLLLVAMSLHLKIASADVFRVTAGTAWSTLGGALKPGDVIALGSGTHLPATLVGAKGTPAEPIRIQPDDSLRFAEISGESDGLRLVGCEHIQLDRIAIRTSRGTGLTIEGNDGGPSRNIQVRNVLVNAPAASQEVTGIRLQHAEKIDIEACRIENCRHASILVSNSTEVRLRRIQVSIRIGLQSTYGLRVEGNSRLLIGDDLYFRGNIHGTLDFGTRREDPTKGPSTKMSLPSANRTEEGAKSTPLDDTCPTEIRITRCRAVEVEGFLRIGCVRNSSVQASTVVDPRGSVYAIETCEGDAAGSALEFSENLIVWPPGGLRRIAMVEMGANPKLITLGENLWWSKEISVALPVLLETGEQKSSAAPNFPGDVRQKQIIDIDPQLGKFSRPENPAAQRFGSSNPSPGSR
jgi:hypothetical protein